MKKLTTLFAVCAVLSSGAAQATLTDRGGGLLYDDVLNVTWLQDANLAQTSGYDTDGLMSWNNANYWAANLVYHDSVRNVDYSDWRLASNTPVNGAYFNLYYSYNGSTDRGYNITSPASELAYMYYVNLGLKGYYSPTGAYQPDYGVFGNGFSESNGGQANVGLVVNLKPDRYWSGTVYETDPANVVWGFSTFGGDQLGHWKEDALYAWAVRPGDVAAITATVPEPETYAMFLAGLGLMGFMVRRRKSA
ncbi:MAG: PEP-CTERM sorting domain-containing protein [Nitrosospira sp.]|nr:PEP-CTERM sorting domain-containing protein [Nitrosospira sp.]